MTDIPVETSSSASKRGPTPVIDVEREVTKRALIEAVTSVVLVVLYMLYSFLRDRDPGVVALDGSDDWS